MKRPHTTPAIELVFLRLKEIEMLTDQERLTLDVMEGLL